MSKRKKLIVVIILALLVASGAVVFASLGRDKRPAPPMEPEKFYSRLTGKETSQEESERPILGVMIENSEASRPQTGLGDAGVIFEAVTEGGITRFLALYQEDMPERLGPVRSVRPSFVDWAMGFDASMAHVGGSGAALNLISTRGAKTLNQFANPTPYARTKDRLPPHNMYARTEALRDLQAELGHESSSFNELPRTDDTPVQEPDAKRINVTFSGPAFATQYRYDAETNTYVRYLAGKPHIDKATDAPIRVNNILVIRAPSNSRGVGSGEAWLFKDGTTAEITWQQTAFDERIEFLDGQGNQVPLNRGMTWIAAIPRTGTVNY